LQEKSVTKHLKMKQAEMRRRWGNKEQREVNEQDPVKSPNNDKPVTTRRMEMPKRSTPAQSQNQSFQAAFLSQEPSYAETCLPLTAALAEQYERVLSTRIDKLPNSWPFVDKVLVLLEPSFEDDVARYRSEDGPDMSVMFKEHQLEHLDRDLTRTLSEFLEAATQREQSRGKRRQGGAAT
jgi:hypothetical protein